jgi:hypothetical protein
MTPPDAGQPERASNRQEVRGRQVLRAVERDQVDSVLRSLGSAPNNLTLELSSFVGRNWEIAEVRGRLGGTRLLTLTGPGGSGKTRLALEVANHVAEGFEDGAWWAGLASLSDLELLPQAVVGALRIRCGSPVCSGKRL